MTVVLSVDIIKPIIVNSKVMLNSKAFLKICIFKTNEHPVEKENTPCRKCSFYNFGSIAKFIVKMKKIIIVTIN